MIEPAQNGGDDLLRLDRQVCFPLYAATNLIQRLYRPLLAPLGLTYAQYLVMLLLWEREPLTISEVRDCLYVDIGTLSPLLKRMEKAGFLTRSRDTDDERRVLVALTPHGRTLKQLARDIPAALAEKTAVKGIPAEEIRGQNQALVAKLVAALT